MDAESLHVASLQAELEEMETVINEQAEHIQWLKSREVPATSIQVEAYEETIRILTEQISRRTALITELCDALERVFGRERPSLDEAGELVQRAREATR